MKENKSVHHIWAKSSHSSVPVTVAIHHSRSSAHHYSLRKGCGFWDLTFAGESAVFKHEQGAFYVARLLLHPPAEPIHALALALEIKRIHEAAGASDIADPITGLRVPIAHTAILQQRSLGLDAVESARALHRKQQELEALLDDEEQIEPVKAEAQRELEAIYQFQKHNAARIRTSAEKAADAVGKAIKRLYRHLATAEDTHGEPHPVLTAFGDHLLFHLLVPSGRCGTAGRMRGRESFGGCFTYEPPIGVKWSG